MSVTRRALLCAPLAWAGGAHAQTFEPASIETIEADVRYLGDLAGPQAGSTRGIYIWRAPSTPGVRLLPTLYMADGGPGVYVAAARLRPAIEAGLIPPIQIIGLEPDMAGRRREYAEFGRPRFRLHERWVLETVIPWAERVARASPLQRAVGGYSHGADFALAMGAAHPDIFSAVLALSPVVVSSENFRLDARAANVRWAVSAGRIEMQGYSAQALSVVEAEAAREGAALRLCTGAWRHEAQVWTDLAPGAIAWLFAFPTAGAVGAPLETDACRVVERRA